MAGPAREQMTRDFWFPAKRYGWGWGPPTTWQGWVVLAGSLAATLAAMLVLLPAHLVALLIVVFGIMLLLLIICYAKGEPPRWRWGERE
jgi:hypothetical protein